jgi:predicted nucleic acid-binding protein
MDAMPQKMGSNMISELRRGVEWVRHRGDVSHAVRLERWLEEMLTDYQDVILGFDSEIAATALIHDLKVVTRNVRDFESCGVSLINPFD